VSGKTDDRTIGVGATAPPTRSGCKPEINGPIPGQCSLPSLRV
jgi:hypothetical protein